MTDLEMLEQAWNIIANVDRGNWDQNEGWVESAGAFRAEYLKRIEQDTTAQR